MSTAWLRFLFWLYLLFLVGADATVTNPADPDLWHRLALGETLWKTGHFPPGDAFSYLADYQNVADHEWGSALIFYALWQWAGPSAIVVLKLATLTVTLALLVCAGLQNRKPTLLMAAFYALVLLALLPSFQSTLRCMTFTHIFFALWLYWFQRERHGHPVPTYLYVLSIIVWANLHGGFAIGLAWLLAVTLLALWDGPALAAAPMGAVELRATAPSSHPSNLFSPKTWAFRFLFCSLATLINPFGPQLWVSTGRALLTTRRGFDEWAPVSWWSDLLAYPGYKLLFTGLLVALVLQIFFRGVKRIDRPGVILVGLFMALSLTSARHTSLFAAVAGALVPDIFPREPRIGRRSHPFRRLGFMALGSTLVLIPLYFALGVILQGAGLNLEYPHVACPREAVDYLQRQHIRGRLLVSFNYGSYALWQLRGQMRVSMDGRYDLVYKPETYRRVDDFFFARDDWKTLLTTPAPDAILVPITAAIYPKLKAEPGWQEAYHDDTDAVFLPR